MNSNKRDIYFEGRIYVGCEKICPDEKRDFNNYWGRENSTDCDGFDREQFNHDVKQFYAYLSTLTSYPVQRFSRAGRKLQPIGINLFFTWIHCNIQ